VSKNKGMYDDVPDRAVRAGDLDIILDGSGPADFDEGVVCVYELEQMSVAALIPQR
jgi:hypothetical protein